LGQIKKESIKGFENKYQKIVHLISIIILITPILFFNEEYIRSNEILTNIINFFVNIFPNIENISQIGRSNGIDFFIKIQIVFSFIAVIITALFESHKYIKLYLCSLKHIPYDKNYFNQKLNSDKVGSNSNEILWYYAISLLIIDMYLTAFLVSYNYMESSFIFKFIFSSKIGVIISSYLFISIISLIIYTLIDSVAHVHKRIANNP